MMGSDHEPSIFLCWEAEVLAYFVIVYTFGSACASFYTFILHRLNGKAVMSISLIAAVCSVQSLVCMSQAIVVLLKWPELMIDNYKYALSKWRDPTASIAHQPSRSTPDPGISLIFALRIIGIFFYNVEALIFFFWTLTLMCSVTGIKLPGLRSGRFHQVTKWLSFLLPAIQTAIINIPAVMATTVPQFIIYNIFLVLPCFLGMICHSIVLYTFSTVRLHATSSQNWTRKLRIWQQQDRGHCAPAPPSRNQSTDTAPRKQEDRFLFLRFCLTFVLISLFQISFIFGQVVYSKAAWTRKQSDAPEPEMGWTREEQLVDWAFFVAGSSVGYFVMVLFATTPECREAGRKLRRGVGEWWAGVRGKEGEVGGRYALK